MKRLMWPVVVASCFILSGCGSTIKTAKYTFNQGTPSASPSAAPSTPVQPKSPATLPNLAGNCGNTIVIVEDTKQDSEADGAISTQGSNAATGAMKDIAAKLVNDLRKTNSENPTTTTNTTNTSTTTPTPVPDEVIVDEVDKVEDDIVVEETE